MKKNKTKLYEESVETERRVLFPLFDLFLHLSLHHTGSQKCDYNRWLSRGQKTKRSTFSYFVSITIIKSEPLTHNIFTQKKKNEKGSETQLFLIINI